MHRNKEDSCSDDVHAPAICISINLPSQNSHFYFTRCDCLLQMNFEGREYWPMWGQSDPKGLGPNRAYGLVAQWYRVLTAELKKKEIT